MDETKQKEIFSKNLRYFVEKSGKQQKEVAKDLGISYTTFNTWINGRALPNAAKIQTIADYFRISKSALLDDMDSSYYEDANTARLAQEAFEDPDVRSVFYMKKNMDPDVFRAHMDYMKRMYKLEHPEDDDDFTGC